jgi:hypothetical protein
MCQSRGWHVTNRLFLDKKLDWGTNLVFFSKIEVSSVMRIETQVLKNKVSKTHGPKIYLTQNFINKQYKYKTHLKIEN